jgi:hypothetical protein|tara:strand:+ start:55 stop:384 length:330 start_codon:yes stop_codon:yes gene_type:complete
MTVSYETTIVKNIDVETWEETIDTIAQRLEQTMGWRLANRGHGILEYKVPLTMRSWGERVRITIEEGSIRIESWCSFPTQVIDWGKNRQNVDLIRLQVKRIVSNSIVER